jgi:hypothetical protein
MMAEARRESAGPDPEGRHLGGQAIVCFVRDGPKRGLLIMGHGGKRAAGL